MTTYAFLGWVHNTTTGMAKAFLVIFFIWFALRLLVSFLSGGR